MSVCDRAKNYLLTYAQCDLPNEVIMDQLLGRPFVALHGIRYMVVSKEHHQTGEEHHHVFISLTSQMIIRRTNMDALDLTKELVEEVRTFHPNIKTCKSPKDAIRYVKKEGEYITYGICPYKDCIGTKEKNDLLRSKSLSKLVEDGDVSLFKIPQLQKAIQILQNESMGQQSKEKPYVEWYYGETGTGKTREAYSRAREIYGADDIWISHESGEWFDGYNGQRGVILDDIRAATWPLQKMLRILDRYPISVPIKGGFVWWIPERIWITAPGRPQEIYMNYTTGQPYDHIEQLVRRIDSMKEF